MPKARGTTSAEAPALIDANAPAIGPCAFAGSSAWFAVFSVDGSYACGSGPRPLSTSSSVPLSCLGENGLARKLTWGRQVCSASISGE